MARKESGFKVTKEDVSTIVVNARRWLDKKYGNTYHTMSIIVLMKDGDEIELISPMSYGSGDQFLQDIGPALGWEDARFWHFTWRKEQPFSIVLDAVDIPRRKDLHDNKITDPADWSVTIDSKRKRPQHAVLPGT